MTGQFDPIEIPVTIDDSKISSQMANVGRNIEKHSAGAKLAIWGLGESAENAAQALGVPNQMSRQLGNSVENMAGKLGMGAVALGGIGFAAMAGVASWNYYREAQEKARAETMKAATAAMTWIFSSLSCCILLLEMRLPG